VVEVEDGVAGLRSLPATRLPVRDALACQDNTDLSAQFAPMPSCLIHSFAISIRLKTYEVYSYDLLLDPANWV
jgi:hypothetical protein